MLAQREKLCYNMFMKFERYRKIYERQAAFYRARPWAKRTLVCLNYALTGLIFAAYLTLLLARVCAGEWYALFLCLLFPSGCFCAVFLLRELVRRKRPYDESGAGITPLFKKLHGSDKSFPSRHIAMAFAIGGVCLPWSLALGLCVYAGGLLLGYIRYAAGLHFPTDLLGGALIGGLFGILIFAF